MFQDDAYVQTEIETQVQVLSLGHPKIFIRNKPGSVKTEIAEKGQVATNLEDVELQIFSPLSNKKTALSTLKVPAELTTFKGSLEVRSKNLPAITEKTYSVSDFVTVQGPVQIGRAHV